MFDSLLGIDSIFYFICRVKRIYSWACAFCLFVYLAAAIYFYAKNDFFRTVFGTLLSRSNIFLFLFLTSISASLFLYSSSFYKSIVIPGQGGRDPTTGAVLFQAYLSTLSEPERTLSALLELVYSAPRDWITTIYVGIIPFIFFCIVLCCFQVC